MNRFIIFLVSFFIFPGYYAGLSLFYLFQKQDLSRFYTVPLRVLLMLVMAYFIIKSPARKGIRIITSLVITFSIFYSIKIFYTEIDAYKYVPLSKPWYEYLFYFVSFNVLPFFFYSSVDIKRYGKLILDSVIFSGFVFGVVVIAMYKDVLLSGGIGRISNLYYVSGDETISPLALSYSGALVAALIFYQFIFQKKKFWSLLFSIITLLLSLTLIFMGASRGAIVAVIFSLILILMFTQGKNKIYLITSIALLTPVVIYIMELTGSELFGRVTDTIDSGDTSGRETLWNDALQEFYSYPFLGGQIEVSGIYPHNIFLELLMATGVVGFLMFFIILVKSLFNGVKISKQNSVYLIALIILANGIAQYLFSGSIWQGLLLFAPMGMLNKKE